MRHSIAISHTVAVAMLLLGGCAPAIEETEPVRVAVAANFTRVQQELAALYTRQSGLHVESSFGSTGALYSQIVNGAPYHVFLAADADRPARLDAEGYAVPDTRFTYAEGTLVLYAPGGIAKDHPAVWLRDGDYQHLAICKPDLAPYGLAAQQALNALGVWDAVQPRLVQGDNVSQSFQYVESGNAELGFVALSQLMDKPDNRIWRVPREYYDPIRQDAVLLKTGAKYLGATGYLEFLRSDAARAVIEAYGYSAPVAAPEAVP